jgi:predicted MFS family arabinose efflux permease
LLGVQVYWAVVSAALAVLTLTGVTTIGLVLALTVLSAIAQAFDGATRQTVLPRLVPRRAIVSAVGLNSMSFNVAQFIGPMVGGVLIGPIGVGGLMVCNAVSFVALIGAILASSPLGGPDGSTSAVSPWRSLSESFEFVWREPTVRWAMTLSLLGNLLARPFQLLLPAFTTDVLHGDASDLSWLMTAAGIGALIGAFGTASLGSLRRRGVVFAASGVAMGALLVVLGVQWSLWPSAVLAFAVAVASQLFITMASALFHTHTPDVLRGRVMGLSTVVVQGGMSTGSMLLGGFGALLGTGVAMSLGGGLYALVSGGALARVEHLRRPSLPPQARPVVAPRAEASAD